MGLLACLARRPGDLVLKEEILAEVWPGQFIADSGLTRCIAELRHLLDDIDSGRKLVPLAELGLARTLARAGDTAASRRAYEQFFDRWKHADAGLPLLAEARAEYQALPR